MGVREVLGLSGVFLELRENLSHRFFHQRYRCWFGDVRRDYVASKLANRNPPFGGHGLELGKHVRANLDPNV